MCTVSVIPLRDEAGRSRGFRLVTNRDEQRSRAPAIPPKWIEQSARGKLAIYPIDAETGGTWVAASEDGLCLCLLNANPGNQPWPISKTPAPSRGGLIPALLHSPDARAAMESLASIELRRSLPFTLLAAELSTANGRDPVRLIRGTWSGTELQVQHLSGQPLCLASSGLGDDLARPRLALFDEMVAGSGDRQPFGQDAFHRHCWPERRHISVLMSRADARTVSITTVEVLRGTGAGPVRVRMDYEPVSDPQGVVCASQARARGSQRRCYDPNR